MVYTKYDLYYSIDLKNGRTLFATMDFTRDSLKEVFSLLYTEVVESTLEDMTREERPEKPEVINEVRITITKKRVKAEIVKSKDTSETS